MAVLTKLKPLSGGEGLRLPAGEVSDPVGTVHWGIPSPVSEDLPIPRHVGEIARLARNRTQRGRAKQLLRRLGHGVERAMGQAGKEQGTEGESTPVVPRHRSTPSPETGA